MTALRGSGPEPFSLDRMRRDIADQLGTPAELVGDDDDLLQLGLDSLGLMRLSARWSQAGAKVTFAELIEHRTLAQWWRLGRTAAPAGGDVALVDEAAPFPLATMQHAYWVGRTDGQVLGGVGAHFYNEFDGTGVRPDDLERAVHALIARHPMLRCRFAEDGTQQIMASGAWSGLTVRDLRCHAPQALGAELDRVREQLSHRRLDAGRGEVFDVSLSLLPGGATRVHVQIEMLVADAQSFRVLMADLASLYRRPEEPLAPLGYSYARYRAVASTIVAPERDDAIAYWRDRLPDLPGGPELPVRVDPAQIARPTVTRRHHWLSGAQRNELAQRCRDHGVTLSMVFLTTYAEVLAAWSANPRFLLNLPLYDRQPYHPDVADLVGDFTNLLLLEVDASEDVPFLVRVRQVQDQFARDVRHSAYSGVEVLRDQARVHTDRGSSAPVVFTSALSLGDLFSADVRACFGEPGWTMSQTPQVWLDCQVTEREGGLFVNWDAVDDLLAEGVLDAMFAAYRRLLVWLSTVDWGESLPVLLPVEQAAVRAGVNGVVGGVSGGLLAGGLFEWAVREPGRVAAVEVDGSAVGYGELADRALRLAGLLVGLGVVAGDPVAVSLPRGVAQLVAVAGVLAAGGVYVPVGVEQPVLRRERIFARAGVSVVVGEDGWVVPAGVELVTLGQAAGHGGLSGPVSVGDDALAYVIFTSGSTGEPKGVEVSHRAAVNTIEDVCVRFGVGAGDRVLAVSALDFDLSVFDMFGMWSVGGAVVLVGEDIRRDARAWLNLVRTHHVTVWQSVPAYLEMLLIAAEQDGGELGEMRLALLGGDWVGLGLRDALVARQPGARLIALGGTTETAIHSSVFEVGEVGSGWRSIPYGVPLRNQMFRVVDRRGRDCPDWVAGELWIGGVGVAAGYRGDPERTAARFVTHAGLRWYRTGDLGRYWPDATLEFLGRSDFQVKVRGHRIELGEIEAALHAYPGVRDAVVVTVGGRSGQLAAGIVGAAVQLSGLPEFLAARLPSYMTPDRIVMLDRLPLSPNGKIDRPAVAAEIESRLGPDRGAVVAPQGEVETAIADLWRQLLEVDSVGRFDSFFTLGGDSLLATRLIGRMRAAGLDGGDLRTLFASPRLADFAQRVRTGTPATAPVRITADREHRYDPFPPTDVQRAYWMGRSGEFTLGAVGSHWYWEFDGADTDVARLEDGWNRLVVRHEMLRAVFDADGQQRIMPQVPLTRIPITEASGPFADQALAELRERLAYRIPDPTRWPVAAVEAVRYNGRVRLAFSFDYIVLDALSIVTIFAELSALYRDPQATLSSVDVSFRDYVLGAAPAADQLAADQAYWRDRLPDLPPAPQLPVQTDPTKIARPHFVRREARLSPEQWSALRAQARSHQVTPASVLATAFAEVLNAWSAKPELTLNLTLFDRREVHPDIDNILGDFTSLLLVAHKPDGAHTWLDLVRALQEQVWSGMEHSAVSAIWVLRELARYTGEPAVTMPVVFTSALGVSDELVNMALPFGEQVWGISQTPQVWLDCQVMERAGGLSFNWDAVEELFPPGVLDAMFAAYRRLLVWLSTVDWGESLPVLLPVEQAAVRAGVNGVVGGVSGGLLAGGLFEWAVREPGRVAAVEVDGSAVGYGELADRALRLAGLLVGLGVVAGDPVAVSLPRGVAQLVAVAGVLAAGGVYVPVGVEQPVLRRERIFARAGVSVVVGEDGWVVPAGVELVTLGQAAGHGGLSGPVSVGDDALAYVIFTSGSTGEPKGVEVSHRAAVNTIEDVCVRFGVGAGDRVLAVSALDFDLSVFDMFGMWSVGGAVVLVGEDIRRDARAWLNLVRTHHVTVWNSVPALLDMLLVAAGEGDLGALRVAMVSGDWVGLGLRDALVARQPGARLIALGGATEAAIWSNFFEVGEVGSGWRSIPYGVPLRNQMFRVVDRRGRDCPDWVAGELWIGGVGVAAGYRGDPERTAARFVTHAGLRWYRTGDLGRYWPDATLEFLGRSDFQVKVRGHRIELGEIEAALHAYPGVRDAVVVTVGGRSGQLAAGIVGAAVQLSGLPEFLAARLPSYMTPDRIVMLDRLPLSPNGKIDREALRRQLSIVDAPTDEPPLDGVETVIADLWRQLLEVDSVGRFDSFFTLGGDSLLATRLVEALRVRYGVDLPLRVLFERPAVSDLAEIVEKQLKDAGADAYEEGEL